MRRKICVFTGTRAEYGLLKPLMSEIKEDEGLDLFVIVSAMHLSGEFGLTYRDIVEDGFEINEKVDTGLDSDTSIGLSASMGRGIAGISEAYSRLAPDVVVVLGDRVEAFAAAAAAMMSRIPIAHLHGGESTRGLIDEAIRHSITKMSHLHFTSVEEYRGRVIQMGEQPDKVFNVGAIGLDNIRDINLLSKEELEKDLGIKFGKYNFLVTFHPVTLEEGESGKHFRELLDALDRNAHINAIFTKANADHEGSVINRMIDEYVSENSDRSVVFTSMGQLRYLSAMRVVDAVVGNSSSGIIEAPSFGVGTINIGDRQGGRVSADSVIDCAPRKSDIIAAIEKLYSEDFQASLSDVFNPYGDGGVAKRVKDVLKSCDLANILKKVFYDISGQVKI